MLQEATWVDLTVNPGLRHHNSGWARAIGRDQGKPVFTHGELMASLLREDAAEYEEPQMVWARDGLAQHGRVTHVTELCERVIHVTRNGLSDVDVVVAEVYSLGAADVTKILRQHPDAAAILNMNSYSQYTHEAKQQARHSGVGLFTWGELFGALNFEGSRFLDYALKGRG